MSAHFPYEALKRSPAWKILEKGIADLVANGDITENTARRYVVGYLCRLLADRGMLPEARRRAPARRKGA